MTSRTSLGSIGVLLLAAGCGGAGAAPPPSMAASTEPPSRAVPCEVWRLTPHGEDGYDRTAVPIGDAATAATAPPALTRAEAIAAGGERVAFGDVELSREGSLVHYAFDAEGDDGRASAASEMREGQLVRYAYVYECTGHLVELAGGMIERSCRAVVEGDGARIACEEGYGDARCDTPITTLATPEGEVRVLGCLDVCTADIGYDALVLLRGSEIVTAMTEGHDMGCMQLDASIAGGTPRVVVRGGGEDGSFEVTYDWADGAPRLVHGSYADGDEDEVVEDHDATQ
ncbi:MAG: hypothetical protein U0234_18555 [Sandaracinus sp.]